MSLADLIVLAGAAAVEQAAKDAGTDVKVPFTPGRMDAVAGADRRPVLRAARAARRRFPQLSQRRQQFMMPEEALVDRAQLLRLSAPEMTALLGGLRVLGANAGGSKHGVFTDRPGTLTNDFFLNLLDMGTEWSHAGEDVYEGRDRRPHALKWTATRVDLIFGSHSQLRAIAEVYGSSDAKAKFVKDFVGGLGQGDERRPVRAETEHRPHRRLKRTRNGAPLPAQAVLRPGAAHRLQIWRQSPHHGWC